LGINDSVSQTLIVNSPLKRGLFRTFNDFKYNTPDTTINFTFDEEKEKLNLDTTKYAIKRMEIWGFSDGVSVFIIAGKINKLQTLDRYCYFKEQGVGIVMVAGGYSLVPIPIPRPYKEQYVINLNNGNTYNLDNGLMKKILGKDKELLNQFNKEPKKKDKYLDYIKAYNDRHKDELKVN